MLFEGKGINSVTIPPVLHPNITSSDSKIRYMYYTAYYCVIIMTIGNILYVFDYIYRTYLQKNDGKTRKIK